MTLASDSDDLQMREQFALRLAMAGSLFMGVAGVLAAILSNSQAILVDGLFSLISFTAAFIGIRISRRVEAAPDRFRPYGYAADEPIFTTFRALSLLGLVVFASVAAVMNIVAFAIQGDVRELVYEPMVIYFGVIGLLCLALWFFHWNAWRKTGRRSEILKLEATSFAFDGAITLAAGLGLGAVKLLENTALGTITPIGDSIVSLMLCGLALFPYTRSLRQSVAELAGATARPEIVARARRAVRAPLADAGMRLVDLGVTKIGRSYFVALFVDPGQPVNAQDMDQLDDAVLTRLKQDLTSVDCAIVVSRRDRSRKDTGNAQ